MYNGLPIFTMKLNTTLVLAVLCSLTMNTSASPTPPTNHHTSTATTTSTSAQATPTVLVPPTKFSIKIVKPATNGVQCLGYISLPPKPVQGSLVRIANTASPFYFDEKEPSGQGIVFSSPDFFTASTFALSYNTNNSIAHSPVYLSNLLDDGAGGLYLIDFDTVRLFGDTKNLYLNGVGSELGGVEHDTPVVFSLDEAKGELWMSTDPWKYPTVYLQIEPITS